MLLKKGLQNVDIEPLIVVHGYVAKPDHGLEALAKRGLNDLRLFQEHKVFFQAVRQPEFLVSHDVSCQVNGCLHGSLKVEHEDVLNVQGVEGFRLTVRSFLNTFQMPSNGCNFGKNDIAIDHGLSGEQRLFDGFTDLFQVEIGKHCPDLEFACGTRGTFKNDFTIPQDLHT